MNKCLVYGCPNAIATTDTSVQFYYFPKHPVIAQQWLNACCVWNPEEVDINTAKICSIHFDSDSYTSEYKMVDYVGYTRVLKFDTVPTLYLPQQTVVYRAVNLEENAFTTNQNYEANTVIIENNLNQQQIEDDVSKYQVLQTEPLQSEYTFVKIEEQFVVEQQCKNEITSKQLDDVKVQNEAMQKQAAKLERRIRALKRKLKEASEESAKADEECSKLCETLNAMERKSMSLAEQKNILSKVFSEAQIKILSGKKKIYWSHDEMAIGYTIRHMSSKRCYMYLTKKLNIPLPGLSSIKRWQSLKKGESPKENKMNKKTVKIEND